METILIVANVVLAIILIILVLLQRSEGGALGLGLSQDNFASTCSVIKGRFARNPISFREN
jgi:protein translocase SecG subunit